MMTHKLLPFLWSLYVWTILATTSCGNSKHPENIHITAMTAKQITSRKSIEWHTTHHFTFYRIQHDFFKKSGLLNFHVLCAMRYLIYWSNLYKSSYMPDDGPMWLKHVICIYIWNHGKSGVLTTGYESVAFTRLYCMLPHTCTRAYIYQVVN
jgi:hypothetical protein